jgi:hypothetical protein
MDPFTSRSSRTDGDPHHTHEEGPDDAMIDIPLLKDDSRSSLSRPIPLRAYRSQHTSEHGDTVFETGAIVDWFGMPVHSSESERGCYHRY